MKNNVWWSRNLSKTSKLMTCFLFHPNHQDTSLSPQHCQLPRRGREGRQRNSWTHNLPWCSPLQGHPTNTNICWDLGGTALKGSLRRKEVGGVIAQPWLSLAICADSSSANHQQWNKSLLAKTSIVILTLLRDSELPVTGHMIHPIPSWAESLLVAVLESLVYNSGASQKEIARVLHFLRTGSSVPTQWCWTGSQISSSQGKHPLLTLMKAFFFSMLELNFSYPVLFWGIGLSVFLFTNSDPM